MSVELKPFTGETTPQPSAPSRTGRRSHAGLLWIGVMKLSKSLFFLAIGIGALHMLHHDLADSILDIAGKLHFDPESHFTSLLLDQTAVLDNPRLREISIATFFYSALAMAEAVGLLLQKQWAEYFTLLLTASFLPVEGYEINLHATLWKWALVAVNLAIVIYLLWVIREGPESLRQPVEPQQKSDSKFS